MRRQVGSVVAFLILAAIVVMVCGCKGKDDDPIILPDNDPPVSSADLPGGHYPAPITVYLTITDRDPNPQARYTVDGVTTPTSAIGTLYNDLVGIAINADTTLQWVAYDASGNVSAVQVEVYVIDTVDPTINTALAGGYYNTTQNMTITANDDKTPVVDIEIYYTTDGVTTPTTGDTLYTAPLVLTDGVHNIIAKAFDLAGNSSVNLVRDIIVDTQAPTCNITSPADSDNIAGVVPIEGTAADTGASGLDYVEIRIVSVGGGTTPLDWTVVAGTANWVYNWDTVAVADDDYTIEARSADLAANVSVIDLITVTTINASAPDIEIVTPADSERVGGVLVSVTGISTPVLPATITAVDVRIDSGSWVAANNDSGDWTAWSYNWNTTPLADGAHTVSARATDSNTYTRTTSISVTVDNTPPDVSFTTPQDDAYVSGTVDINGTATDPDSGTVTVIELCIVSTDGLTTPLAWTDVTLSDPWYSWNTAADPEKDYDIFVRATDGLGNATLSPYVSITVHLDKTPPSLIEAYPPDTSVNIRTGTNIYLLFDEPMDKTSVETNFVLAGVTGQFYWRTRSTDGAEVAIFVPDNYLTDSITHNATLSGATDIAGNPCLDANWSFDTGDCTPPQISSTIPAANSIADPAAVSSITVQFSENMNGTMGWFELMDASTEMSLFDEDISHPALTWTAADTLVLDFDKALDESRQVEVTGDDDDQVGYWELNGAEKGVNTDANGKLYVDIYFAGGAYCVDVYEDAAMTSLVASGSSVSGPETRINLMEQGGSGLSGGVYMNYTADDSDIVLTLPFIELQPGRCYSIEMWAADQRNNMLAPATPGPGALIYDEVLFSTQGPGSDVVGPEVIDTFPANSATGVAPKRLISLLLSEPIDPSSFVVGDLTITDGGVGAVTYQYGIRGGEILLFPDRALVGTVIITLAQDSLNDLASAPGPNSGPASNFVLSFSVAADSTAPVVSSVFPASGTVDIATSNQFGAGAEFSEVINVWDSTVRNNGVKIKDPSGAEIKDVRFSVYWPNEILIPAGYAGVTFMAPIEAGPRFPGLQYWDEAIDFTVEVTTATIDLAGNSLASAYQWTITSVANGASDAAPVVQRWTFDENIWIEMFTNGNMFLEFYANIQDEDNATAAQYEESIGNGDGVTTNWSGTLSATSIWPGSVRFGDGSGQRAWDDWSGNIAGDATGTIDYTTGDYDITWNYPPLDWGMDIMAEYGVGGLDIVVQIDATTKWRLCSEGGFSSSGYEYWTPEADMTPWGLHDDPMQAGITLGAVNTFTFTIQDTGGHTITFSKNVYIPDPGDFIVPTLPGVNDGMTDTTPTFTWTASTIPFTEKRPVVIIGSNMDEIEDDDNENFLEFFLGSATTFTLPDPFALETGIHYWLPGSYLAHPGGDCVIAHSVGMWFERPFWVTEVGTGSISGTVTPALTVPQRDYVLVALFEDPSFDDEPFYWTFAEYNGINYSYAIRNLPNGTYYVFSLMDIEPYSGSPEYGNDPMGMYGAPPPPTAVVIDAVNKNRAGINVTLYNP